jgi:DNA-binding transcriptional ArsR family regulator
VSDPLVLAIAHPTRRRILELALETGEVEVARLRTELDLTFPALSQHLRVLREAGLLSGRREGRTAVYRLTPEPLLELVAWLRGFEAAWASHLDRLGTYLEVTSVREDSRP